MDIERRENKDFENNKTEMHKESERNEDFW